MLFLYRTLLYLALPVLVARLLLRAIKNNDYFNRLGERFGFTKIKPPADGFWVHAVSVGEVNAAVALVNQLMQRWPDKVVTITTMTTTGSDRVLKVFGDNVFHCYLPYDYPGAVSRFIRQINPCLGMVMETEIWPNLICHCDKRNVPLIYTNVRLSERSVKGYRRFKGLFQVVLPRVTRFAVQSEADAKRLREIGAPENKVQITGSIKFDISLPASVLEVGESIRRTIGWNRPVLVVASTHEGEDGILIKAAELMKVELPDLLLVLVPRHPERFTEVARLCEKQGLKTVRRSDMGGQLSLDVAALVVDSMGELPQFIAAGDVVFMAGSMMPIGGHNLLEAAALAKPVVFGPYMFNFQAISELFLEQSAGIQIANVEELAAVSIKLFNDPEMRDRYGEAGKLLVERNRGALDRVMDIVTAKLA